MSTICGNSNRSSQVCTNTLSAYEYASESEFLLDLFHRRGQTPGMNQRVAETNFSYDTRDDVVSKLGMIASQGLVRYSSTIINTCTPTSMTI